MSRVNLFAFTEPSREVGYVGYVSLNREADGSVTLTVREPGATEPPQATITLPIEALRALGDAARFEALQHKAADKAGD